MNIVTGRAFVSSRGRGRVPSHRRVPEVASLERRELLTLLGQTLFPADNPWNQRITDAPVASNSSAVIQNITSQYGDGRFHPDFGQNSRAHSDLYGIPYNIAHGNSVPKVRVVIDDYPDESDIQNAPIPANVVLEGDYQDGPKVGVNNRGDSHLIVFDVDNNVAYEFYHVSRPSENADGLWHAAQETVWNMKVNTFRTLGHTSADAAGLAILPGLARPDEGLPVNQGGQGVINHALRVTLQNRIILNQYLYPASHVANAGNTDRSIMPPMGTRLRLKASVDISTLEPQSKVIAQALKDYGMIVADNGSNFFVSGASSAVDTSNNLTLTWNDDDIQDTLHGLKSLHFSNFEVVDLTPSIASLSASSGAAGSTITINGANFSGAAGRLQVLFGTTLATNVTVVDDHHITAVVPSGSGTVDVRVKSGIDAPGPYNYNSPVFGYGMSAVTAAARFTHGASNVNLPPTIATPASASPAVVSGNATTLSALGADDGGEAALVYIWQVVNAPTGAAPVFQANGSNAAKTTGVVFDRAGTYTFQVTVVDAAGLWARSSVTVVVNAVATRIDVSPASVTLYNGGTQTFVAVTRDQFGRALATQPTYTWSVTSGGGKISRAGIYTAPASGKKTVTVRATAGTLSGTATVSYGPRPTSARRRR